MYYMRHGLYEYRHGFCGRSGSAEGVRAWIEGTKRREEGFHVEFRQR